MFNLINARSESVISHLPRLCCRLREKIGAIYERELFSDKDIFHGGTRIVDRSEGKLIYEIER